MWATNAAEEEGGTVLMDMCIVEGVGGEEDQENMSRVREGGYPTTCYFCQGYGHVARECLAKGKGK